MLKSCLISAVNGIEKATAAPVANAPSAPAQAQAPVILEEWQVPLRFRRELISDEEIEYINVSF